MSKDGRRKIAVIHATLNVATMSQSSGIKTGCIKAKQKQNGFYSKKRLKTTEILRSLSIFRVKTVQSQQERKFLSCSQLSASCFYAGCIRRLRASSYEPGYRDGSVSGMNFVICSYGNFSPVTEVKSGDVIIRA